MDRGIDVMSEVDIENFYDSIAPFYDEMTGFERRWEREKPAVQRLVQTLAIRTAIDAGSGTGVHSLLLSMLGVKVTAVDASEEMLRRLRAHAAGAGIAIETLRSSFKELGEGSLRDIDAVFCMGNSLSHFRAPEDLGDSIRAFARVLRPGGYLIAQLLNYEKILARRERVQSVREEAGTLYVRFYDFSDPFVQFNILTLRKEQSGYLPRLHSITLRPVLPGQLAKVARAAGFDSVQLYGSLTREEFRATESADLVLIARVAGAAQPD